MRNIYVSGSVAYDEIMDFPHHFKDYFHPEKLHQINVSFAVSDLAKHLGGITTNIAYALRNTLDFYGHVIPTKVGIQKGELYRSRVGARDDKVKIFPVASVGRDGDEIVEFFKANNIDTSYVMKDKKLYTATGKVITDMNDNQIWGFYYGASALIPTKLPSDKNDLWIVSATHEKPFSTVLRHVINNKIPYMFDPGMTLTWIRDDLLKKGVLNATYVVGNDYEIAMIEKRIGMTVKELVDKGVNVITTLGGKGVKYEGHSVIPDLIRDPEKKDIRLDSDLHRNDIKKISIIIKACRLRRVVDPTGAGDAWRGGFVGALAAGKPIKECLIMGNVMASFAVATVGTVEYTVTKAEIEKRIEMLS
ncbi:MAG: PfkB family carbohydrate kinase [Microgenomates group bacterium]